MAPALNSGEYVLFDTLAYRFGDPLVGDVVLATHPSRPGIRLIKRVARVRGDHLWLLGDNAGASTDSRTLGLFDRRDVLARAWMVYWPAERMRRI
jgi:nickel-type superoxide dismutase maturation protease